LKSIGPYFFCFDGSKDFFGFLRLVPKAGANSYILLYLKRFEFFIDVKDASSGKLSDPLNPEFVL
jgi:hypothetical protein